MSDLAYISLDPESGSYVDRGGVRFKVQKTARGKGIFAVPAATTIYIDAKSLRDLADWIEGKNV